ASGGTAAVRLAGLEDAGDSEHDEACRAEPDGPPAAAAAGERACRRLFARCDARAVAVALWDRVLAHRRSAGTGRVAAKDALVEGSSASALHAPGDARRVVGRRGTAARHRATHAGGGGTDRGVGMCLRRS